MKITSDMLRESGANCDQLDMFTQEWPDGAEVTRKNLARAVVLRLNIRWAAEHLLTAPAWKVYNEATAPALKVYNEATAPALKVYNEATAAAWKVYNEATAPALLRAWDEGKGCKYAKEARAAK